MTPDPPLLDADPDRDADRSRIRLMRLTVLATPVLLFVLVGVFAFFRALLDRPDSPFRLGSDAGFALFCGIYLPLTFYGLFARGCRTERAFRACTRLFALPLLTLAAGHALLVLARIVPPRTALAAFIADALIALLLAPLVALSRSGEFRAREAHPARVHPEASVD